MHLFNIVSARRGGRKSNLVSIRSILLTREGEGENERSLKKKRKKSYHCFFNLIYY